MIKKFWSMLQPFHSTFRWFLLLLVVYEGLKVAEGYAMSLVIRLFTLQIDILGWVIVVVVMLAYDQIYMRIDNAVDWHILSKHSYPIYKHLKLGAIEKFLTMDIPWHQRHNSGTLVGKVSVGVEKVIEVINGLSWEFIPTVVQIVLSIIPLLFLSPITALIICISFALFMKLTQKGVAEKRPFLSERFDLYEEEWHKSIEIVQSVETNKMFGQSGRMLEEQEDLHDRIITLGLKEAKIGIFRYNRIRITCLALSRRLVFCIWIWQLYSGSIDIANLVFVSILTEKLFSSFWRFARLFDRTTEASEGGNRLANLMNEETQTDNAGLTPDLKFPLDVVMSDVCFAYSQDYSKDEGALHDFSLNIPSGSIIALVGPSGAGKTTIRKVVTKLVNIQSGRIEVGGMNIDDWSGPELLKMFSYVPQGDDVFIFSGNIYDNIAFPRPGVSLEEVQYAASLAGIHDFISGLPEGYHTQVGERGKRLSGGQKQRLALARAILADRPILILDEATSAVDAITEKDIQTNMKSILEGKTAIIIAHRLSTIWDIADKIVVMDNGEKIEEGNHTELMKKGGLYATMVALQTAE